VGVGDTLNQELLSIHIFVHVLNYILSKVYLLVAPLRGGILNVHSTLKCKRANVLFRVILLVFQSLLGILV